MKHTNLEIRMANALRDCIKWMEDSNDPSAYIPLQKAKSTMRYYTNGEHPCKGMDIKPPSRKERRNDQ